MFCGDFITVLHWVKMENKRMGIYQRTRVAQIRHGTPLENQFHVGTKFNVADISTMPDPLGVPDVGPTSSWQTGLPWMQWDLDKAVGVDEGTLTPE